MERIAEDYRGDGGLQRSTRGLMQDEGDGEDCRGLMQDERDDGGA